MTDDVAQRLQRIPEDEPGCIHKRVSAVAGKAPEEELVRVRQRCDRREGDDEPSRGSSGEHGCRPAPPAENEDRAEHDVHGRDVLLQAQGQDRGHVSSTGRLLSAATTLSTTGPGRSACPHLEEIRGGDGG